MQCRLSVSVLGGGERHRDRLTGYHWQQGCIQMRYAVHFHLQWNVKSDKSRRKLLMLKGITRVARDLGWRPLMIFARKKKLHNRSSEIKTLKKNDQIKHLFLEKACNTSNLLWVLINRKSSNQKVIEGMSRWGCQGWREEERAGYKHTTPSAKRRVSVGHPGEEGLGSKMNGAAGILDLWDSPQIYR